MADGMRAWRTFQVLPIGGGFLTIAGTMLSAVNHPHWLFRVWDFPRNLLATVGALSLASFPRINPSGRVAPHEALFVGSVGLATAYQAWRMRPWTKLKRREVARSRKPAREHSLRLVISNVLMENHESDRWLELVRAEDPDVILALEVNQRWLHALERVLDATHPHSVKHPQGNCYGIALWSRLPLVDPQVKFLVESDIPSIHTRVVLRDGRQVRLYGLHPKPPEPIRNESSAQRDAELARVAEEVAATGAVSTVVAGDLNDVAWSNSTERFIEKSGLADPRVGRGMYNSFDANNPVTRWPLDHVFHSTDFTLTELKRLGKVGSDHFPMLIDVCLLPA